MIKSFFKTKAVNVVLPVIVVAFIGGTIWLYKNHGVSPLSESFPFAYDSRCSWEQSLPVHFPLRFIP